MEQPGRSNMVFVHTAPLSAKNQLWNSAPLKETRYNVGPVPGVSVVQHQHTLTSILGNPSRTMSLVTI